METKLIKLSKIKLNDKNPRFIKDEKYEKLKQSIKESPEFLELRPIITNKEFMILGGTMRYRACKELKIKEAVLESTNDSFNSLTKEVVNV
jgi:ParB-like chromosome segregation protein Spo0J